MKLLKSLLPILALGLLASAPLSRAADESAPPAEGRKGGKGGGRGAMSADAMVTRLDEAVTLTADQKAKAKEIYAKLMADTQALPQEDRRTKGAELRTSANKEIRALLTPEQQTKFDAMPQGRAGGGRKKGN